MAQSSSVLGQATIANCRLNIPVPTPVSEWHGTSMQFTKAYSHNQLQDNSLDKTSSIKEKLLKKEEELKKKMIIVQARREKHKMDVEVDMQKYQIETMYLQELRAKEDELLRKEQAAIRIQSFIRGYLFRKHNDEVMSS